MNARIPAAALAAILLAAGGAMANITIDTVPVGNLGNAADTPGHINGTSGLGAVAYAYGIGKYEVTAGQYTAFLNAVAATDTYGLYNPNMVRTTDGCGITQSGLSGSYTYTVNAAFVNRPVNFVSFGDAMRFANWLHNGQPTGGENLSTTEDGAYYLNGAILNADVQAASRKAGWRWAVASDNEWYKAAYYKGGSTNAGYWDYATGTNTNPGRDMADASGDNANYYGNPYPIDSGKYTTVAGEFQNSDSPYGTFDQGGNVWEWTEGINGPYRYQRGGAYNSGNVYAMYASNSTYGFPSSGGDSSVGFRVVVPEPATMVVLALLAVSLPKRGRSAAIRRRLG